MRPNAGPAAGEIDWRYQPLRDEVRPLQPRSPAVDLTAKHNRPLSVIGKTKTMSEPTGNRPNLPLAGITVIDLGQIYQGPYATLLMAKAGAHVIKIEPPKGEPARLRAQVGMSATFPFAMLNSNKDGVSLNLKHPQGAALLKRMVARADVLLENFAPGVMDRLGVGWSVMREINPRLVYASGTGYGLDGPDRDNLAMDLTVQAASGIMSITGFPDGPPVKAGPAIVDFMSGIHLYAAVVTALYERQITGEGRMVEVAMQEAVYPTLASNLSFLYNRKGETPPRTGNRHGGLTISPYNVYATADGHIAIITVTEDHWLGILDAIGRPELKDEPRFKTNPERVKCMDEVDAIVEAWTRTRTRDEAIAILRKCRVPSAPVRDLREVIEDKHMHQRGMLEEIDHPDLGRITVPTSPLRFHGADKVPTRASPKVGQHNSDVYGEWLGLSEAEVAALKADGVI
jgi:crotonobetainyl-CoA:carnitine CoA-transferase CaiB-like acyl-CoA transferase